jgi:hypothetical protein
MDRFCINCGFRLPPSGQFCPSCGQPLTAEKPPAVDQTPPPPPEPPQLQQQPVAPGQPQPQIPPARRLSGGVLFLLGALILLGSEVVRLVTLHADPLDMLGYVIILGFSLPASVLAIRSAKTGKCKGALILASLAMVFILLDLRGLVVNGIHVMENPLGIITPEQQSSFVINKISYAIGHLVAIVAFLIMWGSLLRKRRTA